MTPKTWDMQTQLAVGAAGELAFLKKYTDLVHLDGRKGDFIGVTKRKIELKSDTRSITKTPNFFIERWSSLEKQKPGGPWQSKEHGCYYFVYLFVKEGTIYWMEVEPLLEWIEKHESEYKRIKVFNRGWTAEGLLVPRASLEHLIVKKECIYE